MDINGVNLWEIYCDIKRESRGEMVNSVVLDMIYIGCGVHVHIYDVASIHTQ